jgi:hypothetical protein
VQVQGLDHHVAHAPTLSRQNLQVQACCPANPLPDVKASIPSSLAARIG